MLPTSSKAHCAASRPTGSARYRFLLSVLLLAVLLSALASRVSAACFADTLTLFSPGAKKSQVESVYARISSASEHIAAMKNITLEPKAGRGGSYALGALLDASFEGCFLSGLILPNFLPVSMARESLYAADKITPLLIFANAPLALWVAEDARFQTVADIIQHGLSLEGKPGGALRIAGTGNQTDQHMATLMFERESGAKVIYMPMTSSVEASAAVQRGEAVACWAYALAPHTMPGMRAIAVAGEERSAVLPFVPIFFELDMPIQLSAWFGLAMATDVPEETRRETADRISQMLNTSNAIAALSQLGCTPFRVNYDDMRAFLKDRHAEMEDFLYWYPQLLPGKK